MAGISIVHHASAQLPAHSLQSGHEIEGNQSFLGTARLGDGVSILIAFALAYSYKKIRQKKKKQETLVENREEE